MSGHEKRSLLQRFGLQPSGPSPDDWVEVAEGHVDSATGSDYAAGLVQQLQQVGIEAREKPFVQPDSGSWRGGSSPQSRIRFGVLVRRHDEAKARQTLDKYTSLPISDAELARQAMEADTSQPADEREPDHPPS
jgi:hypothetical protein